MFAAVVLNLDGAKAQLCAYPMNALVITVMCRHRHDRHIIKVGNVVTSCRRRDRKESQVTLYLDQ